MDPRDEPFSSKSIDEQIERLLKQQSQPAQPLSDSARLLRQLRRFYRQQATTQHEQALARAWERIAQQATQRSQATSNHVEQRAALHLAALRRETGQPAPDENNTHVILSAHKGTSTMNTKRARSLAALVTLTVVVAVFALLFTTILPKHANKSALGSSGTPAPKASATATTISLPAGQWASTLTMNTQDGDAPMLFPGNTRILYQNQTPNTSTNINIRRSDDGGATWHQLAVPSGLPPSFDSTSVFVSPLDPNVVFLALAAYQDASPGACQLASAGSNALARLSGGPTCGAQYLSTDGGQHWSRQTLPIAGAMGAPYGGHFQNPTSDEILRPQGQRLYSTISDYSTVNNVTFGGPNVRILASDDGGKTWKLVDADLRASGQNTCDYAPTPTGSTIFALTQASGCYDPNNTTPGSQFLWRSDDGGAHWSQVSQLPILAGDLALALSQNGTAPVLYAHQQQPYTPTVPPTPGVGTPTPGPQTPQGDPGIVYSADGGHTWQHAPASGIVGPSSDSQLYPNTATGPIGTLSDGSVIAVFPTKTRSFIIAAWKPGEKSWHPLAPALDKTNQILSLFPVAGANGKLTFWAIIFTFDTTISILHYDQ